MARRINPINWDYWRSRYVTGEDHVTLEFLSKEPNAPSLGALKRRSKSERWFENRQQYRKSVGTLTRYGIKKDCPFVSPDQRIRELLDAAEMVVRHIAYARALQEKGMQKILNTDADKLTFKEAIELIKLGIEIERLSEVLANQRQTLDVKGLSDAELEAIAYGKSS